MCMQQKKAQDKGIIFGVNFIGITLSDESLVKGHSPNICCDEHRVMQVLLGLQSNALKFTQKGEVSTEVEIINNGPNGQYL